MVRTVFLFVLLIINAASLAAQTTTNTNCIETAPGQIHCSSTTTDTGAVQAEQTRQAYEAGQSLGAAIQQHRFRGQLKQYCASHEGEPWVFRSNQDGHVLSEGRCPSYMDTVNEARDEFFRKHKNLSSDSAELPLVTYIADSHLDPRDKKSWDKAYKASKGK